MDARNMKKVIQYEALRQLKSDIVNVSMEGSQFYRIAMVLDVRGDLPIDFTKSMPITQAMRDRFIRVLNQMLEDAEDKLGKNVY